MQNICMSLFYLLWNLKIVGWSKYIVDVFDHGRAEVIQHSYDIPIPVGNLHKACKYHLGRQLTVSATLNFKNFLSVLSRRYKIGTIF